MSRPQRDIKNLTTSFRLTSDMDEYIAEAANLVGATKAEIYRLGAFEAAKEIHNSPEVQRDLRMRLAI